MTRVQRRKLLIAGLLVAGLGCQRRAPDAAPAERDVTVFAAASLRETFEALARAFEASHPRCHVVLSFAGSQTLRTQLEHGAEADVFASADERHMRTLVAEHRVSEPELFAHNELVLVVAKARAGDIVALDALPRAERIVLGGPEVPIGAYTRTMLDRASRALGADFRERVEAHVVSREPDVRQVLAKVTLGEADAGVVYRTDAMAARGQVAVVGIPAAFNVVAAYPVALTTNAPEPELARAFVTLLLSPQGQRTLAARGFLPVEPRGASAP